MQHSGYLSGNAIVALVRVLQLAIAAAFFACNRDNPISTEGSHQQLDAGGSRAHSRLPESWSYPQPATPEPPERRHAVSVLTYRADGGQLKSTVEGAADSSGGHRGNDTQSEIQEALEKMFPQGEADCVLSGTRISFASRLEAQKLLRTKDEFVSALGLFDRSALLKTNANVDTAEYLAFVGDQAEEWSSSEKLVLGEQVCDLVERIAKMHWTLSLPSSVMLIKTSGREGWHLPYTRSNAIILPVDLLSSGEPVARLLAHELFHLFSRELARAAPSRRDALYAIVGYSPLGAPFELASALRDRKVTNPDSWEIAHSVLVSSAGRKIRAVPFLLASPPRYDPERGDKLLRYLQFKLLAVKKSGKGWTAQIDEDGKPLLIDPGLTNYLELVGVNTSELFQADEVLAENFMLALGYGELDHLPNPELPRKLDAALR